MEVKGKGGVDVEVKSKGAPRRRGGGWAGQRIAREGPRRGAARPGWRRRPRPASTAVCRTALSCAWWLRGPGGHYRACAKGAAEVPALRPCLGVGLLAVGQERR